MKVVRLTEIPKIAEHAYRTVFTGTDASVQHIFPESRDYRIANMNFGKGVRNKFHTHSDDQILIVSSGRGIVATENEEKVVTEGDIILFPAGEKHWHGATKDSEFAHIFVLLKHTVLTQLED